MKKMQLSVLSDDSDGAWLWKVIDGHQPGAEHGYSVAVARCYNRDDAILFAAAPDLLALLAEKAGADCYCSWGGRCWNCRARDAILKAKGQTNE